MSTDPERRLRAALAASAELITDPPDSADYQPPATNPHGGGRPGTRRRRPGPWVAPLLAAAAVVMTVMRRSSTTQGWTSTSVPLGALSISPGAAARTFLSFAGPGTGWLLVSEQITHTGSGELLRTTDGGATWTLQAGQRTLPAVGAIHFLTPQVGYLEATQTGAWWTTRDAGQSWTQLQLPTPATK